MGSLGSNELQKLRNRIADLPALRDSSVEVQNVLIQDENKIREILEVVERLESKGKLPEPEDRRVYLDRVYTQQDWLTISKLEDFADKPIHDLATGYMLDGDVLITDGNHRIALAKLNNQGTARMKVIDLNKAKKRHKIF